MTKPQDRAANIADIASAIEHLKAARNDLTRAGSQHAADAVRLALKSADGAQRHALRMQHQEQRERVSEQAR